MPLYRDTEKMEKLFDKVSPYLDEHMRLPEDAPEDIKKASDEFLRLSKEREEFALSL